MPHEQLMFTHLIIIVLIATNDDDDDDNGKNNFDKNIHQSYIRTEDFARNCSKFKNISRLWKLKKHFFLKEIFFLHIFSHLLLKSSVAPQVNG